MGFAPPQGGSSGGSGGGGFEETPLTIIHSGGGVGTAYTPLVSERTLSYDTSISSSANTIVAYPFRVFNSIEFNRLGVNMVSGGLASSRGRVGIYANVLTSNMYPGALVVESGELTLTGSAAMKEGTVAGALDPGIYWVAMLYNDANSGLQASQSISNHLMPHADPWNVVVYKGVSKAQSYGAMPDPFPSSGSWVTTANMAIGWARNA